MQKLFFTQRLRWERDLWRSPIPTSLAPVGPLRADTQFHIQRVGEAGDCGVRNSRGNSQKTIAKQGASQGSITSSTAGTSFCSKTIPGYTHCQSYAAVQMGRWRMFLDTATSHRNSSSDMAVYRNCTLSRPEHASSLFSARSDLTSSLTIKKCEPLINKLCFKCCVTFLFGYFL